MKNQKRKLFLLTAIGALSLSLVSCGDQSSNQSNSSDNSSSQSSSGGGQSGQYDLVYRSWDYGTEKQNNEERQMIAKFEELYNVKIQVVENPGSGNNYWTNIQASVQNKIDLADVVMVPNMDWPLDAGYLLNIKEYVKDDEEFQAVPASVRDACTFKNGIYAIPARLNMQGYFVNQTLLEDKLNYTKQVTVNSTFDDILAIIDEAANHKNEGIIGIDKVTQWIDILPSNYDETGTYGYFTWDGSQYHLNSQEFLDAVNKAKEYYEAQKCFDSLPNSMLETGPFAGLDAEASGTLEADLWNKGKLAIRYGYSYEIPDIVSKNDLNQQILFVGNPGGKTTIVGDYYGIYKETKNPELAIQFAKFMSYGSDGFKQRMDIYENNSGFVNTLPLSNDPEIVNDYFERFGDNQGIYQFKETYEKMTTDGMPEGVKTVPGFLSARQNKKTGVNVTAHRKDDQTVELTNASVFDLLDNCVVGGLKINDYADTLNTLANKTYSDWMTKNASKYE